MAEPSPPPPVVPDPKAAGDQDASAPGVVNGDAETMETGTANTETRKIEAKNETGSKNRNEEAGQSGLEPKEAGSEVESNNQQSEGQESENAVAGAKQEEEVVVGDGGGEEEEEMSDPSDIWEQLETCLGSIEDSGTFATSGVFPTAPIPVLSIEGIGIVGLPLSSRDAEAIVAVAAQAPFGHGERTVVDTNVRDTWELRPNQVQFLNPLWQNFIEEEVLVKAASDLGVSNAAQTVRCELHKVLLYKEGGHFLPHKDTEKAPGMFGTLMIFLPSLYTGGVVQLSHAGSKKHFDFGGPTSAVNTSYAAWYTDILHSVSPVTSGYRFALAYNMIHTSPAAAPQLPNITAQIEGLRLVLRAWIRSADDLKGPGLICWMLNHQYSEQALNSQKIGALKGVDKHRGQILLDLAKELGFEFYLAQVEYQKTGTVEPDHSYVGYHGGWGYGRGYDDDWDSDAEDKVMSEVTDENLAAHNFVNCKTGMILPAGFKPSLLKEDCLPVDYWDDKEPDSQDYGGFTGNEDATLDYWYHRAAIIIWPSKIHVVVISDLFSDWEKVVFLDRALWTQAEVEQGKRLKFGENIISELTAGSQLTTSHSAKLMEFALEEKRLDLFLRMVEITKSTDIEKMTQAAGVFGVEGVKDVVQRCISNTKGIENQLRMAVKFYQQRPEDLKAIVEQLVSAVSISKEVAPEKFQGLRDLLGPELFQNCILPNLEKDFSNTSFWVSLWQNYPVINWIHKTLPEVVYAHEARIRLTRDKNRYTISSQTLPLFTKAIEMVRADLAAEIINKIQAIPKPADAKSKKMKGKYRKALIAIVSGVIKILQRCNIPITTEPYADFIKKTYVDKILPTLGPKPRPREDFRLPTMRATGQPPCCPNCSMVDIFLADPWKQTISYQLVYPLREHLMVKLQRRPNISIRNDPLPSRMYARRNAVPGTITFTKVGLSAADVTKVWDKKRAEIEQAFIAIGDEQTRKEVFGQLFPIIQMGIRDHGMGWGKEMEEAAIMGEQEEQQMRERRLQSRARAIADAMDAHAETGSPAENRTAPRRSLGVADENVGGSVGRKRKRPLQVIDLTDEL